jgi:hypothetical protein
MSQRILRACVLVLSFVWFGLHCGSPVDRAAIEALGPEREGVRTGPEHRPGQPCLACHSERGFAPNFAVAGTLFEDREGSRPLVGATVTVRDAKGVETVMVSNKVGNFFPGSKASASSTGAPGQPKEARGKAQDITLTYPIRVKITRDGKDLAMQTAVHQEGACAGCHDKKRLPVVHWIDGAYP